MTTVRHNRLLCIPLKYFDETKLLYYPPALVPGTIILRYFSPSHVINTIKRRKNENDLREREEKEEKMKNKIFAQKLLTRLSRQFYIEGEYVYDYTPRINTTLDSVKFIFYENFNRKSPSSIERIIKNTNYIIRATLFQIHREENKIDGNNRKKKKRGGGGGGGGGGGRRRRRREDWRHNWRESGGGSEIRNDGGKKWFGETIWSNGRVSRLPVHGDGGGIKIDRYVNGEFSWGLVGQEIGSLQRSLHPHQS